MKERIRNDPNNFYTYSKDYLSLSIDPYDPEEEAKRNAENGDKRPKFRSVVARSKEEFRLPAKLLPQSKLDEL